MNNTENDKFVGAHVDTAPSVADAPLYAHALGARAFALFTAPPDSFKSIDIPDEVCALFRERCEQYSFSPRHILPHSGFMMNLGSADARKRAMSRNLLKAEMNRASRLGLTMVNFHPGATVGKVSVEECMAHIADSINRVLETTSGVTAVIENTAGQGTAVGWNFEQLAWITSHIEDRSRVGVCIDTCHAMAAGYDMSTPEGYHSAWAQFDELLGADMLLAMHLNDAARPAGSRIDRHASIGQGSLGTEFFRRLMADPRTDNIPLILETPDAALWPQEVKTLYGYSAANNT